MEEAERTGLAAGTQLFVLKELHFAMVSDSLVAC